MFFVFYKNFIFQNCEQGECTSRNKYKQYSQKSMWLHFGKKERKSVNYNLYVKGKNLNNSLSSN